MQGWKLLIYILHIISWTWIVIIMINSLKSISTSYHMFCKYYWFFGIKGFFNGIKNSSFFFKLTTLLSFYRQSEILFFRSTFWLYFLKRRWKYLKKVHSMYIDNDVESRRTKPTVAGHSLNRKVLLSFQFR